jgi:hypothetical protein
LPHSDWDLAASFIRDEWQALSAACVIPADLATSLHKRVLIAKAPVIVKRKNGLNASTLCRINNSRRKPGYIVHVYDIGRERFQESSEMPLDSRVEKIDLVQLVILRTQAGAEDRQAFVVVLPQRISFAARTLFTG